MRIVVAPNGFKGSLTASRAAAAMARGAAHAAPDAAVVEVPVADGGDGTLEVLLQALGGERHTIQVTGPAGRPVEASFGYAPASEMGMVEMAQASGLALLDRDAHDPSRASTRGTGELMLAALDLGARTLVVGLGGSASIDGGMGAAAALGTRFLDGADNVLEPVGRSLDLVARVDTAGLDPRLRGVTIEVLCDVDSRLCGPRGAARVYGPQKGGTPSQVDRLDRGLAHLARVIMDDLGVDGRQLPGGGAAGGLGAGLATVLGARLVRGSDRILQLVGLDGKLTGADLVITGEGRLDSQTAGGKAPAGVARAARAQSVPCVAIVGSIGDRDVDLHDLGIDAVFTLAAGPMTLAESMRRASELLTRTTEHVVRLFLAARRHLAQRAT